MVLKERPKKGQAVAIGIIAVVVVAALIIIFAGSGGDSNQEEQAPENEENASSNVTDEVIATHTVNMTNNGFTPENLTIDQGDTVRFVNVDSSGIWPAVDEHPSHTHYDGTSESQHCSNNRPVDNSTFDACRGIQPSESYEFTFEKTGEWNYHDHLSWRNEGAIIVE